MTKGRLEAFSDGVIAIIITVMVLELKVPQGTDLEALRPVLPALLSYVLSFVFIGIYWNNHHHIFHAVQRVSGMTLWANLHLLFWLSLVPYVTEWIGQSHFGAWPTAVYGLVLLLCAIAWDIERRVLLRNHDSESVLAKALGANLKEWASAAIYALAIGLAFVSTWVSCALYCLVAVIWFVPDRRIEQQIGSSKE